MKESTNRGAVGGPHHTEGAGGGVACDRQLYTKYRRTLSDIDEPGVVMNPS